MFPGRKRWVARLLVTNGLVAAATATTCVLFDRSSRSEIGAILVLAGSLPGVAATLFLFIATLASYQTARPYWNAGDMKFDRQAVEHILPSQGRLDLINAHRDDGRIASRLAWKAWVLGLPSLSVGAALVTFAGR